MQSERNAGELLSRLQTRIEGNEQKPDPALSGVWQALTCFLTNGMIPGKKNANRYTYWGSSITEYLK
jgi:hypothetical protein